MRLPSLKEVVQNGIADGVKIRMDGTGAWNKLVWALYQKGWLPKTLIGRLAAIAAVSVATATLKANAKTSSILAGVAMEVGSDLTSEIGARILALPTESPKVVVLSQLTTLANYRPQRGHGGSVIALVMAVMAFFRSVSNVIGRVWAAFILGIIYCLGFLAMTYRLSLWMVPLTLLVAGFGWLALWVGTVFIDKGKPARVLAVTASIILASIYFTRVMPGTSEGIKTAFNYQDQKNRERLVDTTTETLQSFACNRSNSDQILFFGADGTTGKSIALVFYDYDKSGRVVCFHGQGVNPRNGKKVKAVDLNIVDAISKQEPPYSPSITAPEVQVHQAAQLQQATVATPMEVSTAPVKQEHYVARSGQVVTVQIDLPLDAHREQLNSKVAGILESDITDSDNKVLAARNTPVELVVTSKDQQGDAYILGVALQSVRTPRGISLPTVATQQVVVPVSNEGLRKPAPGLVRFWMPEYILAPGSTIKLVLTRDWEVPTNMVQ